MKYRIIAITMLSCLLLCGCDGNESSSTKSAPTAISTTSADVTSTSAGTPVNTTSYVETASAQNNSAVTETTTTAVSSANPQTAEIDFVNVTTTVSIKKETGNNASETSKKQTTSIMDSGSNLPDDDMNWSPLEPVD